ncbi:conserved hypothetical protein [Solidesulfovibrio fructosivorans JJ]]|uniref:Uncharacterized protein n=1 Tax=Solidesulfovibrio fructosivorans JJ] TaxID=596151 RepID=E1K218_SOLFR|nr:hypothetical protein [Solidesulfovibrio fructosivorans]EFL49331.1 conserved hypothetical protein [Solidesulfovibrio fructosivorans JJ]]
MKRRERTTWIEALDRMGLLKYVVAVLFTGTAFVLIAGAFVYEELGRRPPALPVVTIPALAEAAPPAPGYALRAKVSRDVRFTTAPKRPDGFSFYDISAGETPRTLTAKLTDKRFRMGRGHGESCNFAFPLSGPVGEREAVAAFIRERSRQCCAVAANLPGQLVTYAFSRADRKSPAQAGPISGAAVFSEVAGSLLTLNLRFTDKIDGYETAMRRHLTARFGQPSAMGKAGLAWARDGGLVTMARTGRALSVTAYYAANIENHARTTMRLAARPSDMPETPAQPTATARLALANAP